MVLAITLLTLSIPGGQVPDFTEEKNRSPEKGFDLLKVTQPPKVISPRVCVVFFFQSLFLIDDFKCIFIHPCFARRGGKTGSDLGKIFI